MSLSVDGIWKAGVWATTVWADGVWREGEPVADVVPDSPHYKPVIAPADWRLADDRAFEAHARVAAMADDLEDLERFIGEVESAGNEFVDPWESSIDHDDVTLHLFGTRRRGRR